MKTYLWLIFLLLISPHSFGQKQGNIWYFGTRQGLDFSSGIPVQIFDGQTGTYHGIGVSQDGTSSVCDSAGKLLFYTGGSMVWNRKHQLMPNGTNLYGGTSSTQSSLIVPKPGSSNIFYLFTSGQAESYMSPYTDTPKGYRYNIIDMCLDSNRGDVVTGKKNILLVDTSTEKLCACDDLQGGYWIVGHKMYSNAFYAWHLTTAGITNTVISRIGYVHGSSSTDGPNGAVGEMKFNPAGNRIALALSFTPHALLELFDFNQQTGMVSNICHIAIDSPETNAAFYAIEFSPDGSKLYAGVSLGSGGGGRRLYQYNLSGGTGWDCADIQSSRQTIFNSPTKGMALKGMQTGPDGNIYTLSTSNSFIGRIINPNLTGNAALYDSAFIRLFNSDNYSLPNFIAGYKYHNGLSCAKTTGIEIPEEKIADFYPNPIDGTATFRTDAQSDINGLQLIIQDAFGRIVKRAWVDKHLFPVDMNGYESGIYFYQLQQNGRIVKRGKISLRAH